MYGNPGTGKVLSPTGGKTLYNHLLTLHSIFFLSKVGKLLACIFSPALINPVNTRMICKFSNSALPFPYRFFHV
ncbi:hypothetical protein BUE76_21985 [Cnuella takakiae]|nr:hypothetical protein BUE76_21985 [Cnuella takakiae]